MVKLTILSQTLMSTPIVTFAPGSAEISARNVSFGALQFYVSVSLPLMIATFAAWYGVYWWENRKEKQRLRRTNSHLAV